MIYLLLWIGLFPFFYFLFYTDERNRFVLMDIEEGKKYYIKKRCFGRAILWPASLFGWILANLWHKYKGEFDKVFMLFPIHNPWKD